jgi:cytochrome b pre-mRNA-processing protein 3
MILAKILNRKRHPAARPAYEAIVAAARHPVFYAAWGVPDTVDGRFDMIALHCFLVMNRLGAEGPKTGDFVQALVDEVFRDMDRSLREMGVGDLSVGKKVRKMAEVFYGRVDAYQKALNKPETGRQAALEEVIARNVFAASNGGSPASIALYIATARDRLAKADAAVVMSGTFGFPEPLP